MDFAFTADQDGLRKLAAKVFADKRAADSAAVWGELARAGLLGLALPVESGGAGLGLVELCLLFEQAGRAASPAPLVPALIAAQALATFGAPAHAKFLESAAAGEAFATLALHETGGEPERPSLRAQKSGDGFVLDGVKLAVPGADRAALILVPARFADGATGLFLVAPNANGARLDRAIATDDVTLHQLTLANVRVAADAELAPGRGGEALAWILERATVGACAVELGIAQRQLEMTAEHAVRRKQFGKPIGTFQAVAQRAADMYIDVESLRLVTWQAASWIDEGARSPVEKSAAVATAAYWAAEAGARVAAAAQHLHAGIGFDRGYPLYRYFLAAKRLELELGGANRALARLGATIAATEVRS
ncbi:MAG TPA: acyl-CoA dehydrogenase family protein [Polyangia bacterium]|nr:acyl-CoA dehydrogenase family protein [Polyangia bacterium]